MRAHFKLGANEWTVCFNMVHQLSTELTNSRVGHPFIYIYCAENGHSFTKMKT